MKKKYYYRRKRDDLEGVLFDIFRPVAAILVLGLAGYAVMHKEQTIFFGTTAIGVLVVGGIIYFILKKRRRNSLWGLDDDKALYMLKGMSPSQFENEIADMFNRLGYTTKVTGGANDGGIDVVAYKDGKKYFIQCKKFMTKEVNPHDVRDFLGAVTNVNNPADKGFFVTTGNFTLMAEKAAEGNPRIELIDGVKLVEYYKLSYKGVISENKPSQVAEDQSQKACPQCGGKLELRVAHRGDHSGQKFWGCSNFPKCRYIGNIEQKHDM